MSWIKWVIVSLAIVVFVGAGGYAVYYVAYDMGDTSGYGRGYSTGQDIGYSAGEQIGYSDGYISGKAEGYDEGYDLGQTEGYDEGYSLGLEAGFGHGYTLRDPTYEEAVDFLKRDKTSDNEYDDDDYGVYVCSHFSRDVCNNAEAEGLRCAIVHLVYPEIAGHAIVAFDTIDEGLVYFEAITDERANPEVGECYYKCIVPRQGYYYLPPENDDTILDILVTW
ncbi:MAG: hypothetical protein HQ588_00435 [Deltaproteobacteria bacterium]|nr:hypothetical protein [Deltaproteobacteria bacterium]